MEKEFLVKFGSKTKIVNVGEGCSLPDCIKICFGIEAQSEINIQRYDTSWDEYIDLSDSDIEKLETHTRLKCLGKSVSDNDSLSSVASGSLNEAYNVDQQNSTWPENFVISEEKYSRILKKQLFEEKYLTWSHKHEFLGVIVDDIFKYTYYPNLQEVTTVAKCIIRTYPYLSEKIGSGYDGWIQCLRDKLKHVRRNLNVPVVKWHRGNSEDKAQQSAHKRIKYSPKGKNCCPDFPVGEDKASCKIHVEKMKQVMSDPQGDTQLLFDLMEKTYSHRRSYINECPPVSSIMEEYPALQLKDVFLSEMCRLVGKDCQKVFEGNCTRLSSSLIEVSKTRKETVFKEIIDKMNTAIDDIVDVRPKDVSTAECVASLQLLPHLLGDKLNMFVCTYDVSI